jgi:hypothetical protein
MANFSNSKNVLELKSVGTLDLTPALSSEEREKHRLSSWKLTRMDWPDTHPQNQKRAKAVPSPRGRRLG